MEVFKTRTESTEEPEIAPQAPRPLESDELAGNETKASEPLSAEEKKVEIWEGMHNRKFVTEYFNIGNIEGEFGLKMQTATIDKYIKQEIENKGYEKNIENYEKVLREIENEIGSSNLELFKRISKITNYIHALNRLYKAKALKDSYLNRTEL